IMMLTSGNPMWTGPAILGVLGASAAFLSSPLMALGVWIKTTFVSVRGLTIAVYLMCAFPLAGYFIVLALLDNGSGWSLTTWEDSITRGITPPIVLADCAYFQLPRDAYYYARGNPFWDFPNAWDSGLR